MSQEESKDPAPAQEPTASTDIKELVINLETGVPTDEIESLCMNCKQQGKTRFMYTKIPMFKEIILSSFACEECGFKNTEVQFGGKLEDSGVHYKLKITDAAALNRSIVKSEFATIRIPELDFEIPPQTQKGSINTVEGFIMKSIEGISDLQEQRRKFDPVTAQKIDDFIALLTKYQNGEVLPFTFEVRDPSGNSFIQNPNAPVADPNLDVKKYIRTTEDYVAMGYNVDQAALMQEQDALSAKGVEAVQSMIKESGSKSVKTTKEEQDALLKKMQAYAKKDTPEISANAIDFSKPIDDATQGKEEAISFPTQCYACTADGECKMCVATIPYFKEIIIMCFRCDKCGHKTTEIKQGGGIAEQATKITFDVKCAEDLNRDIFKSDTCTLTVPEIDLELQPGTLGSVYTTVEGILEKITSHLDDTNPFGKGDSATNEKFIAFIETLKEYQTGNRPFTMVLDDPLSNCFIYNPSAPADDPQIKVEVYSRTWDQNEELGINDMKV